MDTDFSVNIITKQKVKEFRKEAQDYRLLNPTGTGRRGIGSLMGRFFIRLFRTPGIQPEGRQISKKEPSRFEGSARI